MGERDNGTPTLDRQTPELAAEVRRNFITWLAVGVAGMAAFSVLFALAVDPGLSEVTGGVAVSMFVLFLGLLVPFAACCRRWGTCSAAGPPLLRGRFLRDRYGVAAEALSGPAWRRAMREGGFWASAGRGAVVGWAFLSAIVLAWWGLTGKWSFGVPSLVLLVVSAQRFAAGLVRAAGRSPEPGFPVAVPQTPPPDPAGV